MKVVLFQSSNTQRVAINVTTEGAPSVLISKEWRKGTDEDWTIGKSIEFPPDKLREIGETLIRLSEKYFGKG